MGSVVKLQPPRSAAKEVKRRGRRKGSRNKVTERMREAMEANGLDLVENMLELALGQLQQREELAGLLRDRCGDMPMSDAERKAIKGLILKLLTGVEPAVQFAATRWCLEKLMGKPAQPLKVSGSVTERRIWLNQLPPPRKS